MRATVVALLLAACTPAPVDPLREGAAGNVIVTERDGQVRRVTGVWAAPGANLGEAARAFVEERRQGLGLDASVTLEEPRALTPSNRVVAIDLARDGHPIYGGTLRVHTMGAGGDRRVFSVSVQQPSGFAPLPVDPISAAEAEGRALDGVATRSVDGPPTLMWLSPGRLRGVTEDARLAWRVPTQDMDETTERGDFTYWFDARDGTLLWRENGFTEFDVWDSDGLARPQSTSRFTSADYEDGRNVASDVPDPESEAATLIASAACDRIRTVFDGEGRPCQNMNIYVDVGQESDADLPEPARGSRAEADCEEEVAGTGVCSRAYLAFGSRTLLWPSGRRTFEHELWHAMVASTSPLAKGGLPGAVNEAFADLGSVMATRPAGPWRMALGEEGSDYYEVIRNLTEPIFDPADRDRQHLSHIDQLEALEPSALLEGETGRVHAISVALSHGMWHAVANGGEVFGRRWAPIGFDKAEQLLYRAVVHGSGPTRDLQDAADDLIGECLWAVVGAALAGEPPPPAGISARDCGALVNGLATVGLANVDRDFDGISDDVDTCPDLPNILQLTRGFTEEDCEPPAFMDLCPPTLDSERGTARFQTEEPCDFAVQNGADANGLTCQACAYRTDGGDEGRLQILSSDRDVSRPCQPLAEVYPYFMYPLDDRGQYGAVAWELVGEVADIAATARVVEQLEPFLSRETGTCTGPSFAVEQPLVIDDPPPPGEGRGDLIVRFSGRPSYPITARLPAGRCDPPLDCSPQEIEFDEAETETVSFLVRQYEWVGALACARSTGTLDDERVDIQLTDATGVQTNVLPALVNCF